MMFLVSYILAHPLVTAGFVFSVAYTIFTELRARTYRRRIAWLAGRVDAHNLAIKYLQTETGGEKTPTSYYPIPPKRDRFFGGV